MFDYQTKGCTKYGAFMGRASTLSPQFEGNVTLRHVPIDDGGYDPGGAYWGDGLPLFYVSNDDGEGYYFREGNWRRAHEYMKGTFTHATVVRPTEVSEEDIAEVVAGFTEAAIALSEHVHYTTSDVTEESQARIAKLCAEYVKANAADLLSKVGTDIHGDMYTWTRAGWDLWDDSHMYVEAQDGQIIIE